MKKQKQKQEFQQTNTYAFQTPPETADVAAVRGLDLSIDPATDSSFNRRKEDFEGSYLNPLGAYTSQAVRDSAVRAGQQQIEAERQEARAQGHNDLQGQRLAKSLAVAELTAPRLVQTGTSGSQTTSNQGGGWGQAVGAGAGIAAKAVLM